MRTLFFCRDQSKELADRTEQLKAELASTERNLETLEKEKGKRDFSKVESMRLEVQRLDNIMQDKEQRELRELNDSQKTACSFADSAFRTTANTTTS
jgi:hypothetical protein